jgi:hypothetical protein
MVGLTGHGTAWVDLTSELQLIGSELLGLTLDLYCRESEFLETQAWAELERPNAA